MLEIACKFEKERALSAPNNSLEETEDAVHKLPKNSQKEETCNFNKNKSDEGDEMSNPVPEILGNHGLGVNDLLF
jgi:hypothetical protein